MSARNLSSSVLALFLFIFFGHLGRAWTFNGVLVVAPSTFRLQVEETVFLQPFLSQDQTSVTLSLHRAPPDNQLYLSKTVVVKKNEPQLVTLTLNATAKPLISDLKNYIAGFYKASPEVNVILKASMQGHTYYKSPPIKVALNTSNVFLQTDKPIYSPGQEVKLRIIQTDNALQALTKEIILEVINPKNLIVYQEEIKEFSASKILRHSYFLGPEPILGLWEINVRSGYQHTSATKTTFEVKEYVLPTFDVQIEFPQRYILPETQTLEGKIIARYTFEEPVEGYVALQYLVRSKTGELQKAFEEATGNLTKGEFAFKINLAKARERSPSALLTSWFPGITGSRFKLQAIVTEVGTLTRETKSNEGVLFVRSSYVISFQRTLPDFKPGYTYTLQVDVSYPNGDPAVRVPVLVSEVTMGTLGAQDQPPPQETNSRGRAAFAIAVPFKAKELTATVITKDPRFSEAANAKKQLKVEAHQPVSNAGYLWLQPRITALEDVQVGSIMIVEAAVHNPANLPYTLHYLVVSRGKVISWGKPSIQENTYLWVLNVEIKSEMSPSFRLVVYAILQDSPSSKGHFIADSLRVEVEKKCPYNDNNELKLRLSKDTIAPKGQASLEVLGEFGSYAGVMAVDQAIYALRNESILTRHKLFTELDKTDLGDGAGSGRTVIDIIKNAGLVILIPGDKIIDYEDKTENLQSEQSYSNRWGAVRQPGLKPIFKNWPFRMNLPWINRTHALPKQHDSVCCHEAANSYDAVSNTCIMSRLLYCSAIQKEKCVQQFKDCCPKKGKVTLTSQRCERKQFFSVLRGFSGFVRLALPENGRKGSDVEQELDEQYEDEEFYADPTEDDIRTEFPETWLYEDFEIGGSRCPKRKDFDGCKLPIEKFPDSITTWHFHGLAVSNKSGFCIADPVKATVKQPLFIKLKLPYAAVRTEMLELVATVFNYGAKRLRVLLHITGEEGLCCEAKPGSRGRSHLLNVPASGAASHRFYVIPMKTGKFQINVTARSVYGADVVVGTLRVRDEGVRESKSSSHLLDPTSKIICRNRRSIVNDSKEGSTDDLGKFSKLPPGMFISSNWSEKWVNVGWDVTPPVQAIPGTVRATLELTGSVLGPTLETAINEVEGFFQDAVGCAEQSLIRIAPTLYGALYLQATGQLTPESEEKAKKHLTQAYGFVLKYRQPNGGISVWAGPQHKPTIWLTSYFMRVFCEMRLFVPSVQFSIILSDLKWMATQQKSDGSFHGDTLAIHHVEMTGGLQGTTALTAFTLTSYLACQDVNFTDSPGVISKGRFYLEDKLESLKGHPYALAMITYVLALANSTKAEVANEYLRALAKEDEQGNRFWVFDPEELESHGLHKPWIYRNKPSALSVEITAYALLAQVTLNQMDYAGPIVAWLISQRNSKGAFVSTQDTAVTLEALAAYGKKATQIDQGTTSINVFVNDVLLNDVPLLFDRNSKNVSKILEVPVGKKVYVKAKGEIPVSTTLQINYNSPGKSDSKKVYKIEVKPTDVEGGKAGNKSITGRDVPALSRHVVLMNVCISYTLKKSSGMVIVRIGIPTGYRVDQSHLRDEIANGDSGITNMEFSESSLILYFDQILQSPEERCFQILLRQMDNVHELQPSSIRVYTYYEPDEESVQFYSVVSGSVDMKDHCVGEMCTCIKGNCPIFADAEQLSKKKHMTKLDQLIETMSRKGHYCYIMQILSQSITEDTMHLHQQTNARIIRVIKEGGERADEVLQKQRDFYMASKCEAFKVKSYALISGKKIELMKTITNEDSFRYILDETSVIWDFPSTFVDQIPENSVFQYIIKRLQSD